MGHLPSVVVKMGVTEVFTEDDFSEESKKRFDRDLESGGKVETETKIETRETRVLWVIQFIS